MRAKSEETICAGPSVIPRRKWNEFKREIEKAYDAWDAWKGNQGDWESMEEFEKFVAKSRAKVLGVIEELERGGK